jgi:hypothetical protein
MLTMADQEQKNYYYKVNAEYAEAMFQKMASIRYGIDFCCTPDLTKWSIKKGLLDMTNTIDSICSDSDDPAQPGDENFVPGPCARIDIATAHGGGSITYVPCGSYKKITETYTGNGNVTICYDTNIGYIANPTCGSCFIITESLEECTSGSCFIITESLEECTSTPACVEMIFTFDKAGGELTFTDCEGVYHSYFFETNQDPRLINNSFRACIEEGKFTTIGGLGVSNGDCASVCNSYTFQQGRGDVTIYYVDCNGNEQTHLLEEYGNFGPVCIRSFNLSGPGGDFIGTGDQTTVTYNGECTTITNNRECTS